METPTSATRRMKYDKQFKLDAVTLTQQNGDSVASVARDLGIDANRLHHWKRQFSDHGTNAFPGNGRLLPQDEELRCLQRENALLREERDILKKAMGSRFRGEDHSSSTPLAPPFALTLR